MSRALSTQTRDFYAAEDRVGKWRERGGPLMVYGSTWDVEPETYMDRQVASGFVAGLADRAGLPPVRLIRSTGTKKASYAKPDTIRVGSAGWDHAHGTTRISLLLLVHEVAHHADYHTPDPDSGGHGPAFIEHYHRLLSLCDQPVTSALLRITYAETRNA